METEFISSLPSKYRAHQVKSNWTMSIHHKNVWAKGQACRERGFNFKICVIENDKKTITIYDTEKDYENRKCSETESI